MQLATAPNSTDACKDVVPYSGQVCTNELASLQSCFSGVSHPLNIPSVIDQQQAEDAALLSLGHFTNSECLELLRPFICLHAFGLCDISSSLHTPHRDECVMLRDDACSSEWARVLPLLPPDALPVCEELTDAADECKCLYLSIKALVTFCSFRQLYC